MLLGDLLDHIGKEVEWFRVQHFGNLAAELGDASSRNHFTTGQCQRLDHGARMAFDGAQHAEFAWRDEQDRRTGAPCPPRTPDAVHIGLDVVGYVVVDHMADAGNVDAARRHVGGNHDVERTVAQLFNHPLAHLLVHVAVQRGNRVATRLQPSGQLVGSGLGTHEHQRGIQIFLHVQDTRQRIELVGAADSPVALANGLDRARRRLDAHLEGFVHVGARHATDRLAHRCREQRGLALARGMREDPLDVLDEAHAQHLVGLVEHHGTQAGKLQAVAFDMVDDPPRRADHHMRAATQLAQLHRHALPAIDWQYLETRQVPRVLLERFGNLDRQFPRGRQHQHLRFATLQVEPLQRRQGEGGGLAGTGLGLAKQVAPGQQGFHTGLLDWRRTLIAQVGQRLQQGGGQFKLGKGAVGIGHWKISVAGKRVTVRRPRFAGAQYEGAPLLRRPLRAGNTAHGLFCG